MASVSNLARMSFGNILEWYDFSLYMYFSAVIGAVFFPSTSPYISKLLSFGTFFVGSMARPLGALAMGYLADRFSIRFSINACVVVMACSTFMVAFLPGYAVIGPLAPILLLTLRIFQGLSAGGQFPNLITLSVKEHAKDSGFAVGIVFAISTLGFWLASFVGFILCDLVYESSSLWRVPFALSGVLFVVYWMLNRQQMTVPVKSKKSVKPLWRIVKENLRAFSGVILLTTMTASIYYLLYTYIIHYRIDYLHVTPKNAFFTNSLILFAAVLAYPLFGKLADRFGIFRVFSLAATLLAVTIIPALNALPAAGNGQSLLILLWLTLLLAAIQGAISPLFARAFNTTWQATQCALAYSIGNALSGGAPLAAELLLHESKNGLSILFMGLIMFGILGMWILYAMDQREEQSSNIILA